METRAAGVADIDAVVRLINAAYVVERYIYDGDRTDATECAALLRTGRLLLAESDGELVGCVYLKLRERSGYFGFLSVQPAHQHCGIGRYLVGMAEAWFRHQGRSVSELQIIDVRGELAEFYRRLGYRAVGTALFPPEVPTHLPCHFVKLAKTL
jgi:N-acetylglutamate synthase-like GNAT family acetyltransferase